MNKKQRKKEKEYNYTNLKDSLADFLSIRERNLNTA